MHKNETMKKEEIQRAEEEIKKLGKGKFQLDMRVFEFETILGEKFFKLHGEAFKRLKEGFSSEIEGKQFNMPGTDALFGMYHTMMDKVMDIKKRIGRATKKKNKIKLANEFVQYQGTLNMLRDRMIRTVYLYKTAIENYSTVEYKEELIRNLLVYMLMI